MNSGKSYGKKIVFCQSFKNVVRSENFKLIQINKKNIIEFIAGKYKIQLIWNLHLKHI